jgi:hypothetical protein
LNCIGHFAPLFLFGYYPSFPDSALIGIPGKTNAIAMDAESGIMNGLIANMSPA